ncbi:MAG: ATP-dependent helicase, partial [bacterium]
MKQYTLNSENTSINLKIDYQKELNKEQFDVVTGGDGPCLVLAGAGSGKTRTLVYRVAYLIENGVDPRRILLVTFTNKAAKEMLNRIEVLLGGSVAGLWGGTFHHIGNRLLRTYGRNIGIEPNFNILDDEDSKALVKSCVSAMRVPDDKYFPKSDLIHKIISLSANLSRPIEEVLSTRFSQIDEIYFPILINIETAYQKKKRESNALDYDDLLSKWNELLVKAPEVRQKLSEQFQYILVDEYQDTNYLQGEAIRHLASQHQNILVVGDDSQSIYSFRGADVNNILSFPKVFKDSHTYRLESNYRSTPEILSLANLSIKNNKKQFDKTLHAHKASGQKPALVALEDNQAQAKFICQRIVDLERDENIPLGKIAVLFRAHYLSLELELELNRRNIAYVMRGGLRFFEQAHVKDILAYLKIINNFKDEVSWARILRFQDGIGGASANKIWQIISAQDSFSEVLRHDFQSDVSLRVYNGWMKSREIFSRLLSIEPNKLSDLIEKIIHSGYEDYLKGSFDNFNDRIADLEQLSVFAGGYESLEKFLSDTALSEGFKGEATAGSG